MRKLSSQILTSQAIILTITVLVGFALLVRGERSRLDKDYEQRAASIASAVAQMPQIRRCLTASASCGDTVERLTTRVANATGASYIVVIDMNRVRHSHPYPWLVGKKVEEPIATLDGKVHTQIDQGATGPSANGKVPLYAPDGVMEGEVSAGIRESSVTPVLWSEVPLYALWLGIALGVGVAASMILAARLKRRTFGLELDEITHLLREREAVLHGIREGMIAFDEEGRVTMVNDEARRLLGLGKVEIGGRLDDLVPPGRLRDVLLGAAGGPDQVVITDDSYLIVNRMPVVLAGRPHGAVVTLRDRTELSGALRELDNIRGLTDALRAQQHEFANRMHALAGLLELGQTDEAMRFVTDLSGAGGDVTDAVRARIASPRIAGLILAKAAIAAERGIALTLTEDTWLGEEPACEEELGTILGNLIDNALDALSAAGLSPDRPGKVEVTVAEGPDAVRVQVEDNGPGIPVGATSRVFADGYSTKPPRGPIQRGLGLSLVHRTVQRLGGRITASEGPGAVFTVLVPKGH